MTDILGHGFVLMVRSQAQNKSDSWGKRRLVGLKYKYLKRNNFRDW